MEKLLTGDSKALLDIITEKSPNSIWIIPADLKENISWISSAVSMQRGFTPEEVKAQSLEDIFTPDSLAQVILAAEEEKALELDPNINRDRVRVLELEMKCKDGSTIWTENQVSFLYDSDGKLSAFLGVTKDVSDKKLALERQELAIKILRCLNENDDVKKTIEEIISIIRENLKISSVSFRILDENGYLPHFVSQGFSDKFKSETSSFCKGLNDEECESNCLCGAVVQEELDDKFSNKTERGSFWTGRLEEIRSSLQSFNFRVKSECIDEGYQSLALIPIRIQETVIGLMQIAARRPDVFNKEMMEFLEGIVTSIGLAIEKNRAAAVLEKKEEQLQHSQRLQSVGRLAGGIAHDFNNLLTSIIGYAGILAENDKIPDKDKGDVLEILKAGIRAAELTRQLLAFSRKQVLVKETVNMNDMFADLKKMLLRILDANIQINFGPSKEFLFVEADKSQLEQILMNLVLNARDAMPNGGQINVSTGIKTGRKDLLIRGEVLPAGKYVSIKVSDNGVGIPKADIDNIFEPFYTTKPLNEGGGLGLSVVYGIVRQHGGQIIAESEEGKGTTFEILLPMADKLSRISTAKLEEKEEKELSGRRIFVIEDDVMVLKIVMRVLSAAGAEVSEASTAKDAYAKYLEHNGDFDLILSDIILPDGNGVEIVAKLRKDGYEGSILLTSGHPFDSDLQGVVGEERFQFVQKPFSPKELVKKISSLIKESK